MTSGLLPVCWPPPRPCTLDHFMFMCAQVCSPASTTVGMGCMCAWTSHRWEARIVSSLHSMNAVQPSRPYAPSRYRQEG
jgi:hypothetical protein